MKKYFLFLFLNFVLIGCATTMEESATNNVWVSYFPNGVIKNAYSYKNGKLDGISRDYYETGVLKSATEYKDNEISGRRSTFYPEGSLWAQEVYENGKVVRRVEFDEEGFVISEKDFD